MRIQRVIRRPRFRRRKRQIALPARSRHYLNPGDLERFRNLLFAARTIVEGMYTGKHRSPLKGSSPEFIEYKSYTPGDPVDSVDWKAFARTDRHYIRITERDTDMNCYLLVDCSASMAYRGFDPRAGAPSKYDYAAMVAAALAYLVVRQGDKAGLTLFDTGIRHHIPCGGTLRHMYGILNSLERTVPARPTSLADSLHRVAGLLPRKGLLIVLSDFYEEPAEVFRALSLYTHRRFEIILFHLLHADEHRLPSIPHARFVDLETHARLTCTPSDVRDLYNRHLHTFIDSLRAGARARKMDYNLVTTESSYDQVLQRYLLKRNAFRR